LIKIKERVLEIVLKSKINKLSDDELIETFVLLKTFKKLEKKKGNEYESAFIKIRYIKHMAEVEYINIFKIVRNPMTFDFMEYFLKFEEKFEEQNTDSKVSVNEYIGETRNVSQSICITMMFKIETTLEELLIKKNSLLTQNDKKEMTEMINEIRQK